MFNILVVDDNGNIRKLITIFLVRDGYNIFTAFDGLEALDVLDKEHIELMIADIMMSNMDGYTLITDLRISKHNLSILMIKAKESIFDKRKGFLAGTDDYMVKSIDFDEMLMRVFALFRRAKISNETEQLTVDTHIKHLREKFAPQ